MSVVVLPGGLNRRWMARMSVHLSLASLPVLGISAQVFGLISLHTLAVDLLLPLLVATLMLVLFDPDPGDRGLPLAIRG